ncbi:MAG: DUF6152 family protein [Gammaproteobacteria bacterium]
MLTRIRQVSLTIAGVLISATVAQAHHGGAAYNNEESVTVTGAVTKFDFINPHVLIYIAVTGDGGEVVEWSGELTSPNRLARMERGSTVQWSKDLLQPGDEITLSGNPARSGAPSLRLRSVVDSEGVVLVGDD